MTKEEILDYVMNTPENTNRMVLNDMLNQINSDSGATIRIVDVVWDEDSDKEILSMSFNEIRQAVYNGEIVLLRGGSVSPLMLLSNLPAPGYPMYFSGTPYFEHYGEYHYGKVDGYRIDPDGTLTFIRASWSVEWQEVSGD